MFGGKTIRNNSPLGDIPPVPTQIPNASLGIVEFSLRARNIKAIELLFQEI
jgi:hypothetical protein